MFWIASVAGAALVVAFALRQGWRRVLGRRPLAVCGDRDVGDRLHVFRAADRGDAGLGSDLLDPGDRAADLAAIDGADHADVPRRHPGKTAAGASVCRAVLAVDRFFAWNAGMATSGIARVSQVQLLQPFVTFALAALFAGETITPQIVLFAAAVVATVAISTRTRRRDAPIATD
jgi:hypothetical protein